MKTFYKNLSTGLIAASFLTLASLAHAVTSPETVQGATTVDTAQAKALWEEGATMIDSRKQSDWDAGHIPEALHFDRKNAAVYNQANIEEAVGKNDPVVSYCNGASCLRSSKTAADLVKWGYTNVYYYRDGFPAWNSAGNPIE